MCPQAGTHQCFAEQRSFRSIGGLQAGLFCHKDASATVSFTHGTRPEQATCRAQTPKFEDVVFCCVCGGEGEEMV